MQIGIATCSVHVLAVLTSDWSSQSVNQQTSADATIDGSCVEGNSKLVNSGMSSGVVSQFGNEWLPLGLFTVGIDYGCTLRQFEPHEFELVISDILCKAKHDTDCPNDWRRRAVNTWIWICR